MRGYVRVRVKGYSSNPRGNIIKILQESGKILIKIRILTPCLSFHILNDLPESLVKSYTILSAEIFIQLS